MNGWIVAAVPVVVPVVFMAFSSAGVVGFMSPTLGTIPEDKIPEYPSGGAGTLGETATRTLALLALLQTRSDWSGADLAGRLGVSDRTIRNDVARLRAAGLTVATGQFQAMMAVSLVNDGPVTFIVDSRKRL